MVARLLSSSSPQICSTHTLVMATYLMIEILVSSIGKVLHRSLYVQLLEGVYYVFDKVYGQIEESTCMVS